MTRDILDHDTVRDTIIMTVDGTRSRDEVAAGIARLIELFSAQPTRNVVVDIAEADYDQPIDDIIKDWSLVAALLPEAKVALVYSTRTVQPALAAVGALEASHHVSEAFDCMSEALSWIGKQAAA